MTKVEQFEVVEEGTYLCFADGGKTCEPESPGSG